MTFSKIGRNRDSGTPDLCRQAKALLDRQFPTKLIYLDRSP